MQCTICHVSDSANDRHSAHYKFCKLCYVHYVKESNVLMAAHWYHGLLTNQWHGTSLSLTSPTCLSLPVWVVQWSMPQRRSQQIFISAIFPHLPTSGFRDSCPYKNHRHFIPFRARPQIDECFRRSTWNNASLPVSLTGDPPLQFCAFRGTFSVPTEFD